MKRPTLQQLTVILTFLLFVGFNTASIGCNTRDNKITLERFGMSEIIITQLDQGSTVRAKQDDVIVIRLEENLTTGYTWEIEVIDSSIIELLDSDYSSTPTPTREKIIGRGGTRTFRFRVKSSGQGQIQLGLRRSWESVNSAIESFEVNIRVK